jgi:hypothetical protein
VNGNPYDIAFWQDHIRGENRVATHIGGRIYEFLCPSRLVDVGCGPGLMLHGMAAAGAKCLVGVDSDEGQKVWESLLPIHGDFSFVPYDLRGLAETTDPLARALGPADVAMSTEVAEHLSPKAGDGLVELLCRTSDTVVWSAATPGQGGTDHINEQPVEYWRERFTARGFRLSAEDTLKLRAKLGNGLPAWYRRILIYRRKV